MKQSELIDRYVYAVGRRLPYRMRKDIEQEIMTLIQDMLEERCGSRPVEEKDVRVVLAELGSPEELAGQYSPDRDKCLIGQPYYSKYKMVMKIVWLSVLFGMLIAGGIDTVMFLAAGADVTLLQTAGKLFGWCANIMGGLVTSFAAVTFTFAVMHYRQIPLEELGQEHWENVPRPVHRKDRAGKAEAVAGIAAAVLFLIIFLCAPQIICGVFTGQDGVKVFLPVFDITLVKELWYFPAAIAVLGVAGDAYCLFEDRYTVKMAAVRGIGNALSFLVIFIWMTRYDLMNPEFLSRINFLFAENNRTVRALFANFQPFMICVLAAAFAIDFADVLFRVIRTRREIRQM